MFYPSDDDGVETFVPFRRRVGHEVEIADSGQFQNFLWESGLGTPPISDSYGHTRCHRKGCSCPEAQEYAIHTVNDSSASGNEHHIGGCRGVLYGSPAYLEAVDAIALAAKETGSRGSERTGGHIHVSKAGMVPGEIWLALHNAHVLWPQIMELAGGQWSAVRSNGDMRADEWDLPEAKGRATPGSYYSRIIDKPLQNLDDIIDDWPYCVGHYVFMIGRGGKDTVEWRLWNTMVSKWRLLMAGGVSAALMEAASERRIAEEGQDLLDHLDGLFTPDLTLLVQRQRAIMRGDTSWAA